MIPDVKDQGEIFAQMKDDLQAAIPQLTHFERGSVIRAILQVIAAAISVIYVIVQQLYFNVFPQDADRLTLKRQYQQWGITWDDPETEEARMVVLSQYRKKAAKGTKDWYEEITLENFSLVTSAVCSPNHYGPGTVDLLVMHNNSPLNSSYMQGIEDFFNEPENKIITVDLRIRTALRGVS
jgi:uncharacterized phage protein gp47/JayE